MAIEKGQPAPDFTLPNQFGQPVTLSDFRGKKNVVVMFYPMAFTSICTNELCEIRDQYPALENDETEVISISCDAVPTLKIFGEHEKLAHHLCSDFWPHGQVSRDYGVLIEEKGFPLRGTFIIDKTGIVRWSVVHGPGEARSVEDYKAALAAL
jgi:peroxiredoxin